MLSCLIQLSIGSTILICLSLVTNECKNYQKHRSKLICKYAYQINTLKACASTIGFHGNQSPVTEAERVKYISMSLLISHEFISLMAGNLRWAERSRTKIRSAKYQGQGHLFRIKSRNKLLIFVSITPDDYFLGYLSVLVPSQGCEDYGKFPFRQEQCATFKSRVLGSTPTPPCIHTWNQVTME